MISEKVYAIIRKKRTNVLESGDFMLHIFKRKQKSAYEKRPRGCLLKLLPILSVILILMGIDSLIPKNKYDIGRDTHEAYCSAKYQILRGPDDDFCLYDEKYRECIVQDVIDYKETKEKVYIYGQDPCSSISSRTHYDIYLFIDKEKEQITIWLYSKRQAEMLMPKGKKMRSERDLIILDSYEEFSEEDRKVFDTLSKTKEK